MEIIDLIQYGKDNAISRRMLLTRCFEEGIIDRKHRDPDREMRRLMSEARFSGKPILYSVEGSGYFRPTEKEIADLRAYVKAEEGRAKAIFANLKSAKAVLDDLEHGRIVKVVLPERTGNE